MGPWFEKVCAWWRGEKGSGSEKRRIPADAARLLTHEIKNYVCALKGNTVLLTRSVRDPEQKAIVERIARVVEKLETFALDAATKTPPVGARTRSAVCLPDVARACAATHFPLHTGKFVWDLPGALPQVFGDPGRLEQVFLNLFLNALEAGAGRLVVRFRPLNGTVVVTVEDDGSGCPQETLERIFEPFFSSKEGRGKRGMGLFIVQAILADHRCDLQVRTKNIPGGTAHGLVFTMAFPPLVPFFRKGRPSTAGYPANRVRFLAPH